MAWLRIDDGFTEHPKLVTLTPSQRWEWLEILTWCARNRSSDITAGVADGTRHSTRRRTTIGTALGPSAVQRLAAVRLIEQTPDGHWHVHDWNHYNGSDPRLLAKERQRRHRANTVTHRDRPRDDERDAGVTSRARIPSRPVPTPSTKADAGSKRIDDEPPAAALELDTLHTDPRDAAFAANTADPIIKLVIELRDRDTGTEHTIRTNFGNLPDAAFAYTLEEVQRRRHETDSDAGLAVRILQRITDTGLIGDPGFDAGANGGSPARASQEAVADPTVRRRRFVEGDGHLLPDDELEFQLVEMGAEGDELVELTDLAADLRRVAS